MNTIIGNVGLLLATMCAKGLCTLEQLDQPSQAWRQQLVAMEQSASLRGTAPPTWQNQARDWIASHPEQWSALLELHADRRAAMARATRC